ncbi:hypothetical protein M1271_01940 [Patescibacteria group bacterium]|nr:hypothetical protein [Patescibacteria group bacterium]MCL5798307.1 hypothetical protein [Patescibacteria group bacterium]
MTIEQILVTFITSAPAVFIKAVAVIILFLHLAFSVVVVRQTKLMTGVVEANISPAIYGIAIIHFLFSLFVFMWAILFT